MHKLNRFKLVVAVMAIAGATAIPAQADFRTRNTWVQLPKVAASTMVNEHYEFTGGVLNGTFTVKYVRCTGDLTMTRSARGFYHHMTCGALLNGSPHVVLFDYWHVGAGAKNFRVTNLVYV